MHRIERRRGENIGEFWVRVRSHLHQGDVFIPVYMDIGEIGAVVIMQWGKLRELVPETTKGGPKCLTCKDSGKVWGDCSDSPNAWTDPCPDCSGD